jgi:hypothetical protein
MKSNDNKIVEGQLRMSELKDFLVSNNLPLKVWISEDGTRILDKVEYDPQTNQLVGLVLPLEKDGMPKVLSHEADCARNIESLILNKEKSKIGYIVVAQPLYRGNRSFCLSFFGTNNKFTYIDVVKRWTHIYNEAKKIGIEIVGFSGDGDSRILKAMEHLMKMGLNNKDFGNYFSCHVHPNFLCVQDTIHIGGKMRVRLLNEKVNIQVGAYQVKKEHLITLTREVNRGVHQMLESDLDGTDKMNYGAVERICASHVPTLLKEHVKESDGTQMYLILMQLVTQSFLSECPPLQKLKMLWTAVFFLRIWRIWILESNSYSLKNTFVTRNVYVSVELNAHSMILLLLKLKDEQELFLTKHFSSQPCEAFFRLLRSMTTTESTKINFSTLDVLYRINRVNLQNKIISTHQHLYNFPRYLKKNNFETNIKDLPKISMDEIRVIVQEAEQEALGFAVMLEMNMTEINTRCEIKYVGNELTLEESNQESDNDVEDDMTEETAQTDDEDDETDFLVKSLKGPLTVKTFDHPVEDKTSNFVEVIINQKKLTIKKSTLCWLLRTKPSKVSVDRLKRFQ